MKKIKNLKDDKRGSILILAMLALVGAISIAVAMTSVSIVERKMTTKSRKSTTAFQSANSGIEWAMKKINDAEPGDTISSVFGSAPDTKGQVACDSNLFSSGSNLSCKITFLKRDPATGTRDIITTDPLMEEVVAIRSSGTFGTSSEQVGRALEAYAMPNCGSEAVRVADFCVDKEHADNGNSAPWIGAVYTCRESGKRPCTASELVASEDIDLTNNVGDEWTADITGSNMAAFIDGSRIDIKEDQILTGSHSFRCCRNR